MSHDTNISDITTAATESNDVDTDMVQSDNFAEILINLLIGKKLLILFFMDKFKIARSATFDLGISK